MKKNSIAIDLKPGEGITIQNHSPTSQVLVIPMGMDYTVHRIYSDEAFHHHDDDPAEDLDELEIRARAAESVI